MSRLIQCPIIWILLTRSASGKVALKRPSERLFGPFFQPLPHLLCMLLAALPLFQPLFGHKENIEDQAQ